MNGAVLGALAGFFGALVALGVPLVAFLYRVDKRAGKAVRLLTGDDEIEGDGVIPRLRDVEETTETVEMALEESEHIDIDLAADGGQRDP